MHKHHLILKWLSLLLVSIILTNCGSGGSSSDINNNTKSDNTTYIPKNDGSKDNNGKKNTDDDGQTDGNKDNDSTENNNGDSGGNSDGDTNHEEEKLYGISLYATPIEYAQYHLSPLTDSEFNALPENDKFRVARKLFATFFYGMNFEDMNQSIYSGTFISQVQQMFDQENDISDISNVEEYIQGYKGWGDSQIMIPMLSRLYHLPPGKAYLHRWAAYILTQSILFSPAYELDTVYTIDALNVYNSLVRDMDAGLSLQWITFKHMITDQNWRRFRSPEDNGREMLEIFLMDFNDSHVPLAAKALQNWQLDKKTNTLVIRQNENTEPIHTLFENTTILNGTDFYSAIVLQPDFLTTLCNRLVDIYFPDDTQIRKNNIVAQLVSSQPTSWSDLLKEIVYSKSYLLQSGKTRSYEESFYNIAKTLNWHPHAYSFYIMYDKLNNMHQATMRYKLGRKTQIPLDSQSFAWFHKSIRENIMINYEEDSSFDSWDDGWALTGLYNTLPEDMDTKEKIARYIIETLFLPLAGREPTAQEKQFFLDMIDKEKYNSETFKNYPWLTMIGHDDPNDDLKERGYFALMVLDYLSRLNTTYAFEINK